MVEIDEVGTGIIMTVIIWLVVANVVEYCKVRSGYLTFRNRIYTVELYDRLEIPVRGLEIPARKEPNDVDMD